MSLLRSSRLPNDGRGVLGAKFIGVVPFENEGNVALDSLLGDELDGRQFADLTSLGGDADVIATDHFYVRTRASRLLSTARPWLVRIIGRDFETYIDSEKLSGQSEFQGLHLMECAGNTRAVRFGMIGVASWDGVSLMSLLDRMGFDKTARILVSGFDEYASKPRTPSVPGASWNFTREDLVASRAFLATRMNGRGLVPDHGGPVRLVVPGWYGCACIKWVNEIRAMDEMSEATSQMQEYAARTHQHGIPEKAMDYQAAVIDPTAMPVRVEKWAIDNRVKYKVVGISWGGVHLATKFEICYWPEEAYMPVSVAETPAYSPWRIWTHTWSPKVLGAHQIKLRLSDRSIRARRLDAGYYVRQVQID